ncbi:MAG: tetratricopeptide repeat protein [bacterium]
MTQNPLLHPLFSPNYLSMGLLAIMLSACSVHEVQPPRQPAPAPVVKPKPVTKPLEVPTPKTVYRPKTETYKENTATKVEQLDNKTRIIEQEKLVATTEKQGSSSKVAQQDKLDPYAKQNSNRVDEEETSSAVMSLMLRSRVDVLAGRYDAAIDKLERGLRIEADNPDLWNKLAEVHYRQGNDEQVIAMAQQSLRLAAENNVKLQRRNWQLIAEANKRRGNMAEMKTAMRKLAEL